MDAFGVTDPVVKVKPILDPKFRYYDGIFRDDFNMRRPKSIIYRNYLYLRSQTILDKMLLLMDQNM